ncbi:helix-turn-helix domain-containing protein [Rothia uropygialis]|uniref:hypothetical protein n=1 Tax=Kocuria sp. 36 TaxID=1415402 RepID=UPI00343BD5EE
MLQLMAEGHTNSGIAERFVIAEGGAEKHSQRIFAKHRLAESDDLHGRLTAVLRYLNRRIAPRRPVFESSEPLCTSRLIQHVDSLLLRLSDPLGGDGP